MTDTTAPDPEPADDGPSLDDLLAEAEALTAAPARPEMAVTVPDLHGTEIHATRYEIIEGAKVEVPLGPQREQWIADYMAARQAERDAAAERQAELDAFAAMDPLQRVRAYPNDAERKVLEDLIAPAGRLV